MEEGAGLAVEEGLAHAAQAADELEVLEAGEMGVDLGFLGDVAEMGAEGGEVLVDVAAGEEDFAAGGLDEADDHLNGGGFAGAVGPEVAEDVAGGEGEADVFDGGDGTVGFGDVSEFEHGVEVLGGTMMNSILHSQRGSDLLRVSGHN